MSSSRYKTPSPSPGPKPVLDLTTPAPALAPSQSSLIRTPRSPKKAKPSSDFIYNTEDSNGDPLAHLDEDDEDDFELPSTPTKKAESNGGKAVKQQPKSKK